MSVSYLTLFAQMKEESIEDLFTQAEKSIQNDGVLQRKIANALPSQMSSDKISICHSQELAEKIARLQGKLDQNDPKEQKNHIICKQSF